MGINIITSAWNEYHKISDEDFSAKIKQAISMTGLIKDFNKKDKDKLLWLRDNTHDDIKKSMYVLDRYVDPTKGKISNKTFTFNTGSFKQEKIQYYLYVAIEEVQLIIYKNFKDFKIEQKLNMDDLDTVTEEEW